LIKTLIQVLIVSDMTTMAYEETILAVLGILGIGTLITTSLAYILEKRKQIRFSEQQLKETRYKIIIAKMGVCMNPRYLKHIRFQPEKPELDSEDIKKELEMEWYNSWLFASDEVIKTLKNFVGEPNHINYGKTILAMRRDLWNTKTSLKAEDCKL